MVPSPRTGEPEDAPRTEVVLHRHTGLIEARGHLTRQGADLLCGTADGLRGAGHTTVVVDLGRVDGADDAGLAALHELRDSFTAAGGRLLVRHEPRVPPA